MSKYGWDEEDYTVSGCANCGRDEDDCDCVQRAEDRADCVEKLGIVGLPVAVYVVEMMHVEQEKRLDWAYQLRLELEAV